MLGSKPLPLFVFTGAPHVGERQKECCETFNLCIGKRVVIGIKPVLLHKFVKILITYNMKAIWKSLTFLLIVFFFADNLKAQSRTLNLDDGSIRITSTGYTQGEAPEVTYSGPYTIIQTSSVVSNTITVGTNAVVTITLGGG